MLLTVFTPTFNRAKLLKRLYDSLSIQTFKDYEWLIVDDGSVDNTEEIVNGFINEKKIDIRYIKQQNGGKHRAINHGVNEAKGELFFIVDSDDWLPKDSLETINKYYQGIKDDKSFAGVSGLDGFAYGKNIGDSLPKDIIDCSSIELRFKYNISGDMSEVFRTDVLKEFPFPEYEKEKFCPEALVWNRIATKYKLRYFNMIIYYAEYQPDGVTNGIVKARMNSPMASMICYSELNSYDIPLMQKIKAAINYWRFRFCSNDADKTKISFAWCWTMPLGFIMHLNDKRNTC